MSKQAEYPKQNILGVELDNLSRQQAIAKIINLGKQTSSAYWVVKPYVEQLDLAQRNPHFRQLLNGADLSLPDGVSLKWANYFAEHSAHHWWNVLTSGLRLIFQPSRLRTGNTSYGWGTDFTKALLRAAAKRGLSVFLVGSPKESTIANTREFLARQIPDLKIVGALEGRDNFSGYFNERLEHELVKQLRDKKPALIFLGLGSPRQEKLASRLRTQLGRGVLIAEGGTFDYQSFGGKLAKAPSWMRRRGLEWLWRLIQEPSRLRRQLAIPRFVWQVYRAANSERMATKPARR